MSIFFLKFVRYSYYYVKNGTNFRVFEESYKRSKDKIIRIINLMSKLCDF